MHIIILLENLQVFPGNYIIVDPNNTEDNDNACRNSPSGITRSCWHSSFRPAFPKLNDTELGPQGCERNITKYAYTFLGRQNLPSFQKTLVFYFLSAVPRIITLYYYCEESLSLKPPLSYNAITVQIIPCPNKNYPNTESAAELCQRRIYVSTCSLSTDRVRLYTRLKENFHLTEVHFFDGSIGNYTTSCVWINEEKYIASDIL